MLACHVGDAQLQVERSEQGASVRQGPRAAQCREREQARSICSIVSSCQHCVAWHRRKRADCLAGAQLALGGALDNRRANNALSKNPAGNQFYLGSHRRHKCGRAFLGNE